MLDLVLADPPEHRRGLIERLGLHHKTAFFTLDGMWCAACAKVSERVLKKVTASSTRRSASPRQGPHRLRPARYDLEELMHRVAKLGYTATLAGNEETERTPPPRRPARQVLVAFAFGMQEMVLYIVRLYPAYSRATCRRRRCGSCRSWPRRSRPGALLRRLHVPARRVAGAARRTPGMDTLVALGTLSAFA